MDERPRRHGILGRRLRKPELGSGRLGALAALCLLPLLFSLPFPARAGTSAYWSVDLSVGHDDQILADPEQLGVVEPVADNLFTGSARFLFRWSDLLGDDRFDVVAEGTGTTYGQKVEGGDGDLTFIGAYRRRLSSSLLFDLSGRSTSFRRSEQAEVAYPDASPPETLLAPVFDFDIRRVDGHLGWSVGRSWLLTGGILHGWIRFPGRFTSDDPEVEERQTQLSGSISAMRMFRNSQYVAGEVFYRRTDSNVPPSEFEGPAGTLRARANLPGRTSLTGFVSVGGRSYDRHPADDSTEVRSDVTWQTGATLERYLSPRIVVFLTGNYLHQVSNVEDFEFDQSRVTVGVAMNLVAAGERRFDPSPESELSPAATPDGIRFRYRDAEATSVSLVGGFNGWDRTRHSLSPVGDGLWEVVVPLEEGLWRYAFVVDGAWVSPPEAPRYEDDGFGGRNGVLEVPLQQGDASVTGGSGTRLNR